MSDHDLLYYDRPARAWTEALPLGNGALGAMVFGDPVRHRIALNLDTFWSGGPRLDSNPGALAVVQKARADIFDREKAPEVNRALEEGAQGGDSECYLPLGDLTVHNVSEIREILDYRRTLDLSRAVAAVEYAYGENRVREEWFVSAPHQVLVGHIRAERSLELEIGLSSPFASSLTAGSNSVCLSGKAPGRAYRERYRILFDNKKPGMSFGIRAAAVSDGRVETVGSTLCVSGAKDVLLVLAAEDSFSTWYRDPGPDGKPFREPCASRVSAAVKAGFDALLASHVEDYQKFYDRVSLDLGTAHREDVPTDKRLSDLTQGTEDPGLYALVFNFGRYLAISASRPGTQAMNLQGIWSECLRAPWASNYTVNINTEMNYWPMLSCDLPELCEPLHRMVGELRLAGRKTARQYYGAEGFVCHHDSDIWRMTCPATGMTVWSFWFNGGGWFSRHLWEYYEYTGDEEFLRRDAFPVLRDAALFYLSMLTEDPDGHLILCPSTSPENQYLRGEQPVAISPTTTMTMSICREVLQNVLSACRVLGAEPELAARAEQALPRLLPLRIGSDGRLLEWYEEEVEQGIHHRHVSHLYGLYPAEEITPEKTPELAEAARRSLEVRGDDGTGWSLAWKISLRARLGEGDRALSLLRMQLRPVDPRVTFSSGTPGGAYPNLFCAHPPFQIDGNFGLTAGMGEMLLRCTGGKIRLLPALPAEWREGSVTGLRAKGGFRVSMWWKEGRLTRATVEGRGNCTLCYGDREIALSVDGVREWIPEQD